ncbi:hypothetical protein OSTOST_22240 [Ostertagia ostertagi]
MVISNLDTDAFLDFTNSAASYYMRCLSDDVTVSSDPGKELSTSIFYDVVQALVALWTCVFSLLYSYAWRQHRKKFILSITRWTTANDSVSYSGTSSVSVTSEDYLPKPLCRRHSVSHNSLCSRPPSVNRKYSYAYSHYNACDSDHDEQH